MSSQVTARGAQTAAHNAESTARGVREEVARLKNIIGQVRIQCANDVRKRDVQIQKLKTHLAARQRGNKKGLTGASISITPGTIGSANGAHAPSSRQDPGAPSLDDAEYSLKQESTDFLTELSQSLSDENDSLIGLIRGTVNTLRELQGLPHIQPQTRERSSSGVDSCAADEHSQAERDELVRVPPTSYETLSVDLESLLSSLSELLTNPSFAPIEEVQSREEEIKRLREGWERMESRWHEAIAMMQGWKKRMLSGGDTVNLEEVRLGLCLGDGITPGTGLQGSGNAPQGKRDQEVDEDDEDAPHNPDIELSNMADLPADEGSTDELEAPILHDHNAAKMFDIKVSFDNPPGRRLAERDANIEPQGKRMKRRVSFNTPAKENLDDSPGLLNGQGRYSQSDSDMQKLGPRSERAAKREPPRLKEPIIASRVCIQKPCQHGRILLSKLRLIANAPSALQPRPKSTMPRKPSTHRSSPGLPHPMSVEEKLKLAEQEARQVSPSSTAIIESPCGSLPPNLNKGSHDGGMEGKRGVRQICQESHGTLETDRDDHVKRTTATASSSSPVKRTKIRGRARKRKSTLSPEELEGLLMGPGDGSG